MYWGKDTLSFIVSILPRIGQIIMEGASSLAVNLFVMIFVLLLYADRRKKKMEAYVNDILPFNEANTQEVIREINMIVRSNAIGIPLLAIIQGRRRHDRLSYFRSAQYTIIRFPHLLRNYYSNGRYSIGMVSRSRLSGY